MEENKNQRKIDAAREKIQKILKKYNCKLEGSTNDSQVLIVEKSTLHTDAF